MNLDVILRVATKLGLPFILMFGLYVQWHGDYGPGGGFASPQSPTWGSAR